MKAFALHSALLAGALMLAVIIGFAATGRFGAAAGPMLALAAAYAAIAGAALAAACVAVGAALDGRRIGLLAVLLGATAFAALVWLALRGCDLLLTLADGRNTLPYYGNVQAVCVAIAWGAWLVVYKVELGRRLHDERG